MEEFQECFQRLILRCNKSMESHGKENELFSQQILRVDSEYFCPISVSTIPNYRVHTHTQLLSFPSIQPGILLHK